MLPTTARGWEPKEEKAFPSKAEKEEPKSRTKVSLFWYMKSSYRGKCEELVRQIEENLRHDPRLDFKPAQEILEPKKKVEEAFERAETAVSKAKKALFNLELAKAKTAIQQAIDIYEENLHGFIDGPFGFQPLEKALAVQVSVAFQTGDDDITRRALLKILALRPKVKFDEKKFPSGVKEKLLNLRLERDELGTASIQVASKPNAAVVYLNGKKIGRAPVSLPKVKLGYHYVTLRRDGYKTMTKVVKVSPPDGVTTTIKMKKANTELFASLVQALHNLGGARAGPGVVGASKVLGVKILILGRITMRGNEATVNLFPYDVRTKRLLKGPIKETIDVTDLGTKPATLAKKVLSDVPLDGSEKKVTKKKKKTKKKSGSSWKSFKKSWKKFRNWKGFWYTVGGVAGAVVIGATVGLVLGLTPQDRWTRMPGGSRTVILRHRSGIKVSSF